MQYLLSPNFQIELPSGKPNATGWVEIYLAGTRTKYISFKDKGGFVRNEFRVKLDSLGSAVIFVSEINTYDVYIYDYLGNLVMTRLNVTPVAGGDITIEGVVTDLNNTDGNIELEMYETPEHKREYEVNLNKDFVNGLATKEELQTETEQRKSVDEDLQEQINNIHPGDAIEEGEFIKLEDNGEKTKINVSPTKTIMFDSETLNVVDTDEEIIVGGKIAKGFDFKYKDTNADGLYIAKTDSANTYTGIIYGMNNGEYVDNGITIGKAINPIYPLYKDNMKADSYELKLSDNFTDNLAVKSDIPTFDISNGEVITKCKDSSGAAQTITLTTLGYQNTAIRNVRNEIVSTRDGYGVAQVLTYWTSETSKNALATADGYAHIEVKYESGQIKFGMSDEYITKNSYVYMRVFRGNTLYGSGKWTATSSLTNYVCASTVGTNDVMTFILTSYKDSNMKPNEILTSFKVNAVMTVGSGPTYVLEGEGVRVK